MSTIQRDLQDRLLDGERLKSLGVVDDETICADIDSVLEKRGEVNLRYAILTVIDDGDPLDGKAWAIDHVFPDVSNDARIRFCDAVVEHLRRGL